ncbi:MAG: KpsF/GutQ family sugar-phosphate isomerase [Chlamydiales bacterium]
MMLKKLFSQQQQYIETFFSEVEIASCEKLLQEIFLCKGLVFFTGIGKSGFIAQKIAATMMSTGTQATFLSPIDAIHGDLGMVSKHDLVIILSKSGETHELLQLLPFVRNRGARLAAVTSNPHSRLQKGVHLSVILPCSNELCPFDLAPTISTEVQLLFGDVLAVALMEMKGFTIDQYAANHPGGQIGRRASIKVRQMMINKENTPLCYAEDALQEVLIDFSEKRCGCLIVIDEQKELKGIFTDGDLRRALQAKGEKVLQEKIGDLMTNTPRSIDADALAWDAMQLMEHDQNHPIMVLPVVEKKEVIGVIKMHDLIQAGV